MDPPLPARAGALPARLDVSVTVSINLPVSPRPVTRHASLEAATLTAVAAQPTQRGARVTGLKREGGRCEREVWCVCVCVCVLWCVCGPDSCGSAASPGRSTRDRATEREGGVGVVCVVFVCVVVCVVGGECGVGVCVVLVCVCVCVVFGCVCGVWCGDGVIGGCESGVCGVCVCGVSVCVRP